MATRVRNTDLTQPQAPLGVLAGGYPAWLSDERIAAAIRSWEQFEQTLRRSQRGLLPARPVNPWAVKVASRHSALLELAADSAGFARRHTQQLADGLISLDEWVDGLINVARSRITQTALVANGGADIRDAATVARVQSVDDALVARINALAARYDAGEISARQLANWSGQTQRGLARTAEQMGGMARIGDEPVRRVMKAGEDHCGTCPSKIGTYASLEECLAVCGGWPGDGSDDCHGNCYCTIEPVSLYSVYQDPRRVLPRRVRDRQAA